MKYWNKSKNKRHHWTKVEIPLSSYSVAEIRELIRALPGGRFYIKTTTWRGDLFHRYVWFQNGADATMFLLKFSGTDNAT